jgi:hypothetical protein
MPGLGSVRGSRPQLQLLWLLPSWAGDRRAFVDQWARKMPAPLGVNAPFALRHLKTLEAHEAARMVAHEAAVAAVRSVLSLSWKEASAEAVNAIAYATRYHSEWFWRGAEHVKNGACLTRCNRWATG